MNTILILEQMLNGLQFGLMLFLLAAGLTLVFGVMDMINLAHGSLYMVGAFLAAWLVAQPLPAAAQPAASRCARKHSRSRAVGPCRGSTPPPSVSTST